MTLPVRVAVLLAVTAAWVANAPAAFWGTSWLHHQPVTTPFVIFVVVVGRVCWRDRDYLRQVAPDTLVDMTQTSAQQWTDTELKAAIVAELAWTPGVDSTHIGVSVDQGAVTLSGEVESYPERRIAERAATHVRGVTALAEQMTVRNNWGTLNDADVAREASHALDHAFNVPSTVKATVHEHQVTLSGTVPWHFERQAATQAVRYLRGVNGVINLVEVKPTVSAGGLKTSIMAAFVRNAELESRNLTVTADGDGVVTLEGHVHTWAERNQAEHLAWSAPGVTIVHNRLKIGS